MTLCQFSLFLGIVGLLAAIISLLIALEKL